MRLLCHCSLLVLLTLYVLYCTRLRRLLFVTGRLFLHVARYTVQQLGLLHCFCSLINSVLYGVVETVCLSVWICSCALFPGSGCWCTTMWTCYFATCCRCLSFHLSCHGTSAPLAILPLHPSCRPRVCVPVSVHLCSFRCGVSPPFSLVCPPYAVFFLPVPILGALLRPAAPPPPP